MSWTVTDLTFFYLVFPVILPSKHLGCPIVMMFHLQLLPSAIMIIHALGVRQSLELTVSLCWPLTAHHFPDGTIEIEAAKIFSTSSQVEDKNEKRNFLHDILPWGFVW